MNEAEPSRVGDHDAWVVVSAAEATLALWPRVPWAPAALAALEAAVIAVDPEVSMADAVVVATEEGLAAAGEVSEAVVAISVAVVTAAYTALLAMLPLDLVSIVEMAAAMATVTAATEVTEGVTEALVGMILEAVVAHMTTDKAVAIATVADTAENARTDAPEATMNPLVDEKVGIARGTETTTDLVMMTVAASVVMTVATKIPESCDVTERSSWTHMWWVVDLIFQSLIQSPFPPKGKHATRTTTSISDTLRFHHARLRVTRIRRPLTAVCLTRQDMTAALLVCGNSFWFIAVGFGRLNMPGNPYL